MSLSVETDYQDVSWSLWPVSLSRDVFVPLDVSIDYPVSWWNANEWGWMSSMPACISRGRVTILNCTSTCIRVYFIVLSRVLRTLNVCESCYVVCPDFKCKYLVCTPTNDSSSKQPNHVYYRWSSERKQRTNTSYATRYQEIFKHKLWNQPANYFKLSSFSGSLTARKLGDVKSCWISFIASFLTLSTERVHTCLKFNELCWRRGFYFHHNLWSSSLY